MSHVFISYSHNNADFVEQLVRELRNAKIDYWLDKEFLHAGDHWEQKIDNAIEEAMALLLVMSPSAKQSEYVTYEWAYAFGVGTKIIPIYLEDTKWHPKLDPSKRNYIDFRDGKRPFSQLIADIMRTISVNDETKEHPAITKAIQNLDSSDKKQRYNALETLKNSYPNPYAKTGLINALNHVTTDVQQVAIQILLSLDDEDSALHIATKLNHENDDIRFEAISALNKLKDERTIPQLIQALIGDNKSNRDNVYITLLGFEREIIIPYLTELEKNKAIDGEIKDAIRSTLRRWTNEGGYGPNNDRREI